MKSFIRIISAVFLIAIIMLSFGGCKQEDKPAEKAETGAVETASDIGTSQNDADKSEKPKAAGITEQGKVFVLDSNQKKPEIRKSPSADASTVDEEIPAGAQVTVEDETDGWVKIKYGEKTGWVKSDNVIEVTRAETSSSPVASESAPSKRDTVEGSTTAVKNKTTTSAGKKETTTVKASAESSATAKDNSEKTTSPKATTEKTTTAKAATEKTTAKPTTANSGSKNSATVHIRIHGKKSDNKDITAKVNPGETYTLSKASKALSEKYPGESFRIKGDNIVDYNPDSGIKDFYFDAYFNDTIDITAE